MYSRDIFLFFKVAGYFFIMRRHDWDTAGIYIPRGSFWFLCFLFSFVFLSPLVFFFYSNRGRHE